MKEIQSINILRFICIVGVLSAHLNFNRFDIPLSSLIVTVATTLEFCVFGFFFISGYLQSYKTVDFKVFLISRSRRLLIPFFSFTTLYLFLRIITARIDLTNFGLLDLIVGVAPQLYFLPTLFFIQLSCYFLHYYRVMPVVFFFLVFWAIFLADDIPISHGANFDIIPYYLLSNLFGLICGVFLRGNNEFICAYIILTGLLFFNFNEVFLDLCYFYLAFSLFRFLEIKKLLLNVVFFEYLGKKSSAIFVWHAPFLTYLSSLVIAEYSTNFAFFDYLFLNLIVVTFCLVLNWGVSRTIFYRFFKL